jgi:hypothetical protein
MAATESAFNAALDAIIQDPATPIPQRVLAWLKRRAWGNSSLYCIDPATKQPLYQVDCARELRLDRRRVSDVIRMYAAHGYVQLRGISKVLYPSIAAIGGLELATRVPAIPRQPIDKSIPHVYFLRSEEGPVKIGLAGNVSARLNKLQQTHPFRLRLLGVIEHGGRVTERALHKRFAKHRLRHEWFTWDEEIRDALAEIGVIDGGH